MSPTSIRLRPLAMVLAPLLLLFVSFSTFGTLANDVIYVYDELGRLVAVIDPLGDTATYSYDSVGNILSISRYNSAVVSIVEFTPNSGPTGTTVTIYGTGFSTTPSQNTVSFNGVAATVTSASFSQIVTTVPASATTGPISVTTPAGSAVSAASFVVNDAAQPTITSFSPAIGTPGTAVTITGTNFDTTAHRNRVKFNNTVVNSSGTSTATTIDTIVPSTTSSGRIKVATVVGNATSAADFFIPPSPYTVADVLVADRMTLTQSRTVAMSVSNKIGLIVFDANEGQRASIKVNSSSIANGGLTILDPRGVVLSAGSFSTTTGFIETPAFMTSGTHTILIDPSGTNTGNINFTLNNASDVTGTMTIDGPTTAFSTTIPGQQARITFSGTAGQRISLGMTNVAFDSSQCCSASVSISGSNGLVVMAPTDVGTTGGGTQTVTLPATGSYTILVDPRTSNVGSISLTLTEELSGSMTLNGTSQALTFRTGQNARLAFSGSAGQRVSLGISNVSISPGYCCGVGAAAIYTSSLTALIAPVEFQNSGQGTVTAVLPSSGDYWIVIDPYQAREGSATITLNEDLAGTLVVNGPTMPLTFNPGQNARIGFDGVAGQRVSVGVSGVTIGAGYCCGVASVAIYKPDGSVLMSPFEMQTTGTGTPSQVLPVSGTYWIDVNPYLARNGNLTLTLSEDLTPLISINGSAVALALSRVGQNALLSFSGVAGQRVSIGVSSVTIAAGYCCNVADVAIYKPDGSTLLAPFSFNTAGNGTETVTLPTTGTYTILLNPFLANTGNATVTLSEDLSDSITINGASVPLTFRSGQNGVLTFTGASGQRISVGITSVSIGAGYCCNVASVAVKKPDGTTLLAPLSFTTSGEGTATAVLPSAGTYSIVIDPAQAFSGNGTVTLSEDVSGSISINGSTLPLTFRAGQNGVVTFDGVAGQRVSMGMSSVTIGAGYCCNVVSVSILKPDGTVLLAPIQSATGGVGTPTVTLPTTVTYTAVINALQGFAGDMTLTSSEDVQNTLTINGGTVPLSLSRVGQNGYLTFAGTSGTLVTVRISGNTIGGVQVKLLNPDGTTLTSFTTAGSFNLAQKTLPSTGTYSITVDGTTIATGNISIAVTNP